MYLKMSYINPETCIYIYVKNPADDVHFFFFFTKRDIFICFYAVESYAQILRGMGRDFKLNKFAVV